VCTPGESTDCVKDGLLEFFDRLALLAGENLAESRDFKKLVIGILCFRDSITEENQCVFGLELQAGGGVVGFRN